MPDRPTRRTFLAATAVAVAAPRILPAADSPNSRITVALMGAGGRGNELAKIFAAQPNVRIAYVCDPDRGHAEKVAVTAAGKGGKAPEVLADFRKAMDDKDVDVMVCAAPNHWHAPATIIACSAGKHVYVEKPCSHTPREGELIVEAARKNNRVVQMGNHRRSWTGAMEAVEKLRAGEIGRVYLAKGVYQNNRKSIGTGKEQTPPAGLDYDLWQGPTTRKPFKSNYLHYTWHWFWHWGNGELGNNGIHTIDICRWGLGVGLPERVTSGGGRYAFQDDQETPDTHTVTFDYPATRQSIVWEALSCDKYPAPSNPAEITFFGEKGSLTLGSGGGYTVYDDKGKEVRKQTSPGGTDPHVQNFLAAVRGSAKPNSEIAEGATSVLLCHLGNIAHRTGHSLKCDPTTGQPTGDKAALALWSKEYEKGWEPKV
jgi:predicted dehydrogenase